MTEQIRLGDLLTRAGLLRPEDLREGMLIAKQQSLPVGRVLIMAEFISEPSLQAAVQAQSMLKDGVIDIDSAIAALQLCAKENLSLDDALGKQGWKDKTNNATNKLGGLLTEAGLITQEQLEQGLNQCQMSGLPLGRVLVAMGFMSESLLAAALNAQILIRDSKIQRELAIQGVRACHERQISIEQSLSGVLQIPVQDSVRLGELLVLANLLNQDNLMQAVELGLTESKPIGQVLVEHKMVTEQALEAALAVQKMVTEGRLKKDQCGDVLAMVHSKGMSIDEAIQKLEPPKPASANALPLYQFLQLAGLITAKDIEEALKLGSRDTELMGRMLLLTGSIDQNSLASAARLNEMISKGALKAEQAILAMGLCQNRNCSVEQAFKSLGWHSNLQETIPPAAVSHLNAGIMNAQPQAASGEHAALNQPYGASIDSIGTGQFRLGSTGQHQAVGSGQFQAVDPSASGQYQQVAQSQPIDPAASGQYQQIAQPQPIDPSASGQYQQVAQPQTASGQFQNVRQSGEHQALPPQESGPSSTATSDVPVIDVSNMLLQSPEAFDEPPAAAAPAETAAEDDGEDEDDDGSGGKKKKGGGGGKKRLADLMP